MENMSALELLGLLDLFQADDAGVVNTGRQVLGCVHVREPLELVDERSRLDEELDGFA
jgi:hypothetical protein